MFPLFLYPWGQIVYAETYNIFLLSYVSSYTHSEHINRVFHDVFLPVDR